MTTPTQIVIWTALPTGIDAGTGDLLMSVFVAPQLNPASAGVLADFPDFVDWPSAISTATDGPVAFTATFSFGTGSHTSADATIVTAASPGGVSASDAWTALFDPQRTTVAPFSSFPDLSTYALNSFPATAIADYVGGLYTSVAAVGLTDPIFLQKSRTGGLEGAGSATDPSTPNGIYNSLLNLVSPKFAAGDHLADSTPQGAIEELLLFHRPPAAKDPSFQLETPTLDFHQALSSLGGYPAVLRLFNLVFDLRVPLPSGLPSSGVSVMITPSWTSQLGSESVDFTPMTACTITSDAFLPTPTPGSPDYANGMLALDDGRFTVTDLDVDLAGHRIASHSQTLQSTVQHLDGGSAFGSDTAPQLSMTVPALRSTGPQVLWSGYSAAPAAGFAGQLDGQHEILVALQTWLADQTPANLPTIYAEQVLRGHRFDVYTASERAAAWWSLCGRYGTYVFGAASGSQISFSLADEGVISPAAAQPAGLVDAFTSLYVHESIVRWHGWGLCAQRPGGMIGIGADGDSVVPNPGNSPVAPPASGPSAPQLGVTFVAPKPSTAPDLLFPKLRYGNEYQFRARAVDMAGNSLPLSSTDASTATPTFTHYRFEPVRPPMSAGVAPFTPGESTLFMVLLDDQVNPVGTNGRWLFPPQTSQLMAEEHGMFDGFSPGQPPDPSAGPQASAYGAILQYDGTNLGSVRTDFNDPSSPLIGTYDANNQDVPYFTGSPIPYTPWLPDPLSPGPALAALPGSGGSVLALNWDGVWPVANPILIQLAAGGTPSNTFTPATSSTPATVGLTLPPAQVASVRISSTLTPEGLATLGVWPWIEATGNVAALRTQAILGQAWMLTPYQVLRMVHAVRIPLSGPSFGSPATSRSPGATSVDITDPQFLVDEPSTSHVDVTATWVDPYDNPNDPTRRRPTIRTTTETAFRLTVPDPAPVGPEAHPMSLVNGSSSFEVSPSVNHGQGSSHHIGDTLHHVVYYTATGTSRFADLFNQTIEATLTVGQPFALSTVALGLTGPSVVVRARKDPPYVGEPYQLLEAGVSYAVDVANRTVELLVGGGFVSGAQWDCLITFQPATTLDGPATAVEVLSSARPKAPVISEVVPAWQITGPAGSMSDGLVELQRTGGYLRVYLDRPWFSTGAGEMLGVVTPVVDASDTTSVAPPKAAQAYVTMMGLDPINYVHTTDSPWPVVPTLFGQLGNVPDVPYRRPYTSPPQAYLVEDQQTTPHQIWPYDVQYDAVTDRWYADVAPRPGVTNSGTLAPPPGYFIRLALCRFQPFSEEYGPGSAIEVSPVVTATLSQPVPDRTVVIVPDTADSTGHTVLVGVSGPGYQGWRPPNPADTTQDVTKGRYWEYDGDNPYAPSNPKIYGSSENATKGRQHTSTMVVEVQIQDGALGKLGFQHDLAWSSSGISPVRLTPSFTGSTFITWGGTDRKKAGAGVVKLPASVHSTTKMRLRISEIDYYAGNSAPSVVDTRYRRPFVSLIPLN